MTNQNPDPNLDHQPGNTQATRPLPATAGRSLPRRRKKLKGLPPSPFFPVDVQADLAALFDTLTALRLVTNAPEFSDEAREFLIDCVETTLDGTVPGQDEFTLSALRLHLIQQDGVLDAQWAQRLVQAARRDIARPTCSSWSDLMLYCRYAAEPLGRAVLQRCNVVNNAEIERATDALTAALLVLHLMRRAGEDWRQHGRCFLPTEWIAEEGGSPEQLVERRLSPALRRVCSRMNERVGKLIEQAAPLPALLVSHPSLRAESVRLLAHAQYQLRQLQVQDMLSQRLRTPFLVRIFAHLKGWRAGRA